MDDHAWRHMDWSFQVKIHPVSDVVNFYPTLLLRLLIVVKISGFDRPLSMTQHIGEYDFVNFYSPQITNISGQYSNALNI
ncbi:hypothetical protein L2E82_08324 [Cichorium intybus]|uniref:Uncharacterized protein n=1 Tax=Cichorium intybus TaxID=13427 RepID=A0ACB9G5Y4_CICIN|nr:hypothetical protein L2E82_08324 [Cichorium intybus]